ncbi:hypothetical protein Ddye_027045 [Dipteronia dyeriana]|uniref:Wound-responsive family protein n=1 Tax=Dipteronia dyeriana TaxID=168575 RepID=A0AAD9TPB1_9ROSI|nr:hypothetical protein Ddye_027045 [Dipteronia dyeriana]
MNAAASKAWIVAASIGAVEALKDQGICRWNYTMRSLHQRTKNNLRSVSQAKNVSSSSSSRKGFEENIGCDKKKKTEDSIKKVMDLSCWGPTTVRF